LEIKKSGSFIPSTYLQSAYFYINLEVTALTIKHGSDRKSYILMKKFLPILICFILGAGQLFAQTKTLSGRILDDKGRPVPNATIQIQGTAQGTTSGNNGTFSLEVPASAEKITISSIGFTNQEISIINQAEVSVLLSPSDKNLEEVIVTGYSNVDRNKSPISSSLVRSSTIKNVPITNINDILQGQAAGLTTMSTSGQPGATSSVRIRGIGSITAGAAPIYVLDGIIIESGQVAGVQTSQANDILSNINPNDIESVTILKDAAALALYGARGGNGVIVITTKRVRQGPSTISFTTQFGSTFPSFGNWRMMNGKEVYDYERAMSRVNGASQGMVDALYPASLLNKTFDWVDAAFKKGNTQNYNLAIRGGNEKSAHYFSLGYTKHDGTLINSGMKRITAILNFDHQLNKRIKVGTSFNTSYSNTLNAATGNDFGSPIFASLANNSLFLYPYKDDGSLYRGNETEFVNNSITGDNFLYSAPLNYVRLKQFRGFGKLYGEVNITSWMTFTQNIGIDLIYAREKEFTDPTTSNGINLADPTKSGSLFEELTSPVTFTSRSSISGNFRLKDQRHQLGYLAFTEYQRFNSSNFSAFGLGFANGALQVLDVAGTPNDAAGTIEEYSFLSYLGQLNYSFNDKYALTASLRSDGSSRFGADNRYALFYSVGGSWRIISETFMQKQKLLSDLRLRASYGTSGVADFRNYASLPLYLFNETYNGAPGSAPSSPGNADLTWEKNRQVDIGLELGVLDNRIRFTIDYFRRVSTDVLQDVPVSGTTGFTTTQQNAGELENKGFEISINSQNYNTKDFTWTTGLNLSSFKNKVLELYRGQDIAVGTLARTSEGQPINAWFLPVWAGVDPANGDPLWYLADGKTTVNSYAIATRPENRKFLGSPLPRFTAGLSNAFTYKGLGLSFLLYAVTGSKIYNQNMSLIDSDGQRFGWNYYKDADKNFWTAAGQQAERPKPIPGGNKNSSAASSRWIEKNDYLRLRNITLSYNFAETITRKTGIGSATFFITGVNLLTWTKYKGVDPEVSITGNDIFKYPVSKNISVGLDIIF
jgi:TonB-linked SusC/RagA family outer membrane protein